jgi:hypothetical protein
VQRLQLNVDIDASAARIWRALCRPEEVVRWDGSVVQDLDAPPDYPQPGQHVRWRCRPAAFRLLHDRPQEVEPERRLRSLLDLGPYHMDETYSLTPLDAAACHLDLVIDFSLALPLRFALGKRRVHLSLPLPLLGPVFEPRPASATRDAFAASLLNLKRHCESDPHP